MGGARAALVFLTRLPAGRVEGADFARAPGWFGVVGLLVGAVQAGVLVLAAMLWGPVIGALAGLAAGIALTGALHEDGLADTFDGLGSGRPAERALEIMRDSRIGSFGALALVLVLAGQGAALAAMGALAPAALLAAAGLSRAAMVPVLVFGPYLRPQGAGSAMTAAPGGGGAVLLLGSAGVALALVAGAAGAGAALAGLVGLALGVAAIWLWARRRLGGVTGDICGAVQQAGFIGFLLGVLAWL